MWLAFGQGHNLDWIPVHELASLLTPVTVRGILFFHAFTGCDAVSAFRGKGKKSAWQTWDVCPEVSGVFGKLSCYPAAVHNDDIKVLEKFVVAMYDRSSSAEAVNDARLEMFARKQRPYDAIPPTRAALVQHIKRAVYQAASIWSQALVCQPTVESPADWGWKKDGDIWTIFWTSLQPVAQSCRQLTRCQCKASCHGRCKCYKFSLKCTSMCSCTCTD